MHRRARSRAGGRRRGEPRRPRGAAAARDRPARSRSRPRPPVGGPGGARAGRRAPPRATRRRLDGEARGSPGALRADAQPRRPPRAKGEVVQWQRGRREPLFRAPASGRRRQAPRRARGRPLVPRPAGWDSHRRLAARAGEPDLLPLRRGGRLRGVPRRKNGRRGGARAPERRHRRRRAEAGGGAAGDLRAR